MRISFRFGDPDPSADPTWSQPELKVTCLGTGHVSRARARQRAALLRRTRTSPSTGRWVLSGFQALRPR